MDTWYHSSRPKNFLHYFSISLIGLARVMVLCLPNILLSGITGAYKYVKYVLNMYSPTTSTLFNDYNEQDMKKNTNKQ